MEEITQQQIVFYLTGRREGSNLKPLDRHFRPVLFARYADLSSLRYDFPLVLNRQGTADRAVLSLSKMVDAAVELLNDNPDRDRLARHGYRLERELRKQLAAKGPGDFATMWHNAAALLSEDNDDDLRDSAMRLWHAFDVDGDLFDADSALPARLVRHAWNAIRAEKTEAFRNRTGRLLLKLRGILGAEMVGSTAGRSPERLKAGLGASFAGAFDFAAMSRILVDAKPGFALSDERRGRIQNLIAVLENQKFYRLAHGGQESYNCEFEKCSDALSAYQERHEEAVELVKTLAVAELEAKGEYRESVHNALFDALGANGLDSGELAELPDYLVCTDGKSLDPTETAQLIELLAAGLPVKVLVRTDDVLEPSVVAEGHLALGLRSRQLVNTAIGLTDVFVFQASASHLFKKRDLLMSGLSYDGPALFSVFSGVNGHTGDAPAYLVAAAAMESRAFPALVYDPSAGSDWAARLIVNDNPMPDDDWPVHSFAYEDETLQSRTEELAFTLADFMALDDRFSRHYAIVPKTDLIGVLIPIPEAVQAVGKGVPAQVPSIVIVDDEGRLHRAVLDDRTLLEVRRCLAMWHSLQELGGIHNSHAERLLAKELKAKAAASPSETAEVSQAAASAIIASDSAPQSNTEEDHVDDPYIETARCTSCNECTHINDRMFAYNAEKQAYIADPAAGTFRELVEAAEGCQVSIIHPGKPRNPNEPGIEDLLTRAAGFN